MEMHIEPELIRSAQARDVVAMSLFLRDGRFSQHDLSIESGGKITASAWCCVEASMFVATVLAERDVAGEWTSIAGYIGLGGFHAFSWGE